MDPIKETTQTTDNVSTEVTPVAQTSQTQSDVWQSTTGEYVNYPPTSQKVEQTQTYVNHYENTPSTNGSISGYIQPQPDPTPAQPQFTQSVVPPYPQNPNQYQSSTPQYQAVGAQSIPPQVSPQVPPQTPPPVQPNYSVYTNYRYQPYSQAEIENEKSTAKTLGILSIIFAFLVPIAGLILGIVANSKEKALAAKNIIAKKLGKIGIGCSVGIWALNIIMAVVLAFMSAATTTSL